MARVTVSYIEGFKQQIVAPPHRLTADEPKDFGGDDAGPEPYELLLSALGACTNITLLIYARRKEWDLQEIETELNNDRVYGDDCLRCEEDTEYMHVVRRRIRLSGDLTSEQIATLAQVAAKCPVHKKLTKGLVVEDTVDMM